MPSIEDFVQDLFRGEKEVTVPKDRVTELSPGWYVSKYNLPHKGAKKSWRNGRLHAFDMGDHYSVHLDRVDPKGHGIGHLIQDAPFMFFLWVGFRDASKSIKDVKAETQDPSRRWISHMALGVALLLVGMFIVLNSALTLDIVYGASTAALFVLGAVMIWKGLGIKRQGVEWIFLLAGSAMIVMSVTIFYLPGIAFWMLLLIMAIWTLSSGVFLIFGQGDKLLFDAGSIAPILIGLFSLALAITILINPVSGLEVVVMLAGLLISFLGLTQLVVSLILGRSIISKVKGRV